MGAIAGVVAQVAAPIVAPLVGKAASALLQNVTGGNLPLLGDAFQKIAGEALNLFGSAKEVAGDTARIATRGQTPPPSYAQVRDHRSHNGGAVVRDHRNHDPWEVSGGVREVLSSNSPVYEKIDRFSPRLSDFVERFRANRSSGDALQDVSNDAFADLKDLSQKMKQLSDIKDPIERQAKFQEIQTQMQAVTQMLQAVNEIRKGLNDLAKGFIGNFN